MYRWLKDSSPLAKYPKTIAFASLVVALLVGGTVWAQDGAEEEAASEESEVEAQQRADLTPAEQIEETRRIQERGGQISRRVAGMLDEARRDRDIIRVTCLNDKLTQVNANIRTLEQRSESLSSATEAQDASRRNHEFTVVTVLGQKFNVLEREANQCIGETLFETGATRVTTSVDPETPVSDPVVLPDPRHPSVPVVPRPASFR